MSDLKKATETYAKKTVKDDWPPTGDWVNIAHDFEAGAAWQRDATFVFEYDAYPNECRDCGQASQGDLARLIREQPFDGADIPKETS